MRALAIFALTAFTASAAFAGEAIKNDPKGHLIGNDGVRYVVEGCAAYPVTAEAKPQQSKSVASTDMLKAKDKLAQSKPVETTN